MSKKETVLRQNSVYSDIGLLTARMVTPANTEIVMDWRTYEGRYLTQSTGGLRDIDYLKDTEDVGVMEKMYIVYVLRIFMTLAVMQGRQCSEERNRRK